MSARIKVWTIVSPLRSTNAVKPIVQFSSLFLAIRGLDNGGNYIDDEPSKDLCRRAANKWAIGGN